MTNKYADSITIDNPIAIWALDDTLPPATVIDLDASPTNINLAAYGSPVLVYNGISSNNGYYISSDSTAANVAADNSGTPMVFGASNITNTYPVTNLPSLIVPGFGFLNDDGKDKAYTLEFWARITSSTHYPRKIVGPINSDNGLYVNGPYISLKIENVVQSHYVGEWERPMLIQIVYNSLSASLIMNGETVISINHDSTNFELPTKLNDSGLDQDWIGFYAYSNVPQIQLDCIAIYAYQMSEAKAKLHFVKAQSLEVPQAKFGGFSELPIVIDYHVSKYANNYVYPGNGRWQNGIVKNMSTDGKVLYSPNYNLPKLVLQNSSQPFTEWCDLNNTFSGQSATLSLASGKILNDDVFFRIVPDNNDAIADEDNDLDAEDFHTAGYLEFDKLNMILDPVKIIYGVYKLDSTPTSNEILFRVINKSNEYFEAVVNSSNQIVYRFISGSTTTVIETVSIINTTNKFSAGIDIDQLLTTENNIQLSSFFTNQGDLKVFLGGSPDLNVISDATPKMFRGNIYKFGFGNKDNLNKIYVLDESSGGASEFSGGIVRHNSTILPVHVATYTLVAINTYGVFDLDIAVDSYWEDYVPLSLLAKNVIADANGTLEYSLDFIQINIDHPETISSSNATVKTYVEFSDVSVSTVSDSQLEKTYVSVSTNNEISPDATWLNKKYQILNNTIVHLPTGGFSDFNNLSIAISLQIQIPGIKRNPIKIRKLHLAAQAYNYSQIPTEIGTRHSRDIIPYTRSDVSTIAYNGKNPYTIYKDSTPYLYLNKYSGIKLVGSDIGSVFAETTVEKRGVRIPINPTRKDYYKVSVLQLSLMKDTQFTANSNIEIFRIVENENILVVDAQTGADAKVATVRVRKSSGTEYSNYSNVRIYMNGKLDTAVDGIGSGVTSTGESTKIRYGQWNIISLVFDPLLSFGSISGSVDITGPFVINNVADYQIDRSREGNAVIFAEWGDGAYSIEDVGVWSDVLALGNWRDILEGIILPISLGLNAGELYGSYLGIGKIEALESFENEHSIDINQNATGAYLGIRSSIITAIPL
jgi:hypothetical protein